MARTGWLIQLGLLLLLVVAPWPARAQAQQCANASANCTQPQAYAACRAELASYIAIRKDFANQNTECVPFGSGGRTIQSKFQYKTSANSAWFSGIYRTYTWTKGCDVEPTYTGTGPWSSGGSAKNGSIGCRNGCDGMWSTNVDSTKTWTPTGDICPEDEKKNCDHMGDGYYWNSLLKVCEPPEGKCPGGTKPNSLGQCAPEPCPDGMAQQQDGTCKKKENECPAGQVRSPDGRCLPGDGQCAKGEVRGPDGTCKKDSDDDGKPDEPGEKDTFSGGDDCSMPPSCSGSPILCGQARIQWRIDCNTRRNRNIAGGSCSAMPVCTGEKCDAMEYAGLLMQWRTACATEKMAGQGNNGGDGSQPEWTKVGGMNTDPGAGSSPDDTKVLTTKQISISDLDQSGIGGGGSCMGFAGGGGGSGIGSGFVQVMASPPPFFCDHIAHIKAAIILFASVTSVFILGRGAP